jgi:hypothetical protein
MLVLCNYTYLILSAHGQACRNQLIHTHTVCFFYLSLYQRLATFAYGRCTIFATIMPLNKRIFMDIHIRIFEILLTCLVLSMGRRFHVNINIVRDIGEKGVMLESMR